MSAEIAVVSADGTCTVLHHRWGATRLHIYRTNPRRSAQRACGMATGSATIGHTNRKRVALKPGDETLRATGVLLVAAAIERHRRPLTSTTTAAHHIGNTRHEARAVGTTTAISGAAQNIRATMPRLRPAVPLL